MKSCEKAKSQKNPKNLNIGAMPKLKQNEMPYQSNEKG
jgi:hypothetical protein